jgi:transcriptional regulator with XRE-family HTH domain
MNFAENLHEAIEFSGLTQKELAKRSGISLNTLLSYLKHENPSSPTVENAVRLAQVLGTSVEKLVLGDDSRRTSLDKVLLERLKKRVLRAAEAAFDTEAEGKQARGTD